MKDTDKSICHYSGNTESNLGKKTANSDIGLGPGKDGKLVPFTITSSASSTGGMEGTRTSYVRAMGALVADVANIICNTKGIKSLVG